MARVKHGQDDWLSYHISTRTVDGEFHLADQREKERIVTALAHYRNQGHARCPLCNNARRPSRS